ncbi:MAG: hypothetical protein ACP5P3_03765 [Ignavibacteria bacterium]
MSNIRDEYHLLSDKGPIIQFTIRDRLSNFMVLKTIVSSSYLTFASGGDIININPIAIGMFVGPHCSATSRNLLYKVIISLQQLRKTLLEKSRVRVLDNE